MMAKDSEEPTYERSFAERLSGAVEHEVAGQPRAGLEADHRSPPEDQESHRKNEGGQADDRPRKEPSGPIDEFDFMRPLR